MARQVCEQCQRPLNTCWCHCCVSIENQVEIGIFQHPSEQKQVKSTVPLLLSCLQNQAAWVGEKIGDAQPLAGTTVSLQQWLANPKTTYLLYPAVGDEQIDVVNAQQVGVAKQAIQVLVLDGTWRKTYKLLQLNPELQALPRIAITPQQASQYKIRKQKNAKSLSTIEAVAQLLTEFGAEPQTAEQLNNAFECFQNTVFSYSSQN